MMYHGCMKRLLWSACIDIAIPIIFLLGLPQVWEYWVAAALAFISASLVLWEYSLAKNTKELNDDVPQEQTPTHSDQATS